MTLKEQMNEIPGGDLRGAQADASNRIVPQKALLESEQRFQSAF